MTNLDGQLGSDLVDYIKHKTSVEPKPDNDAWIRLFPMWPYFDQVNGPNGYSSFEVSPHEVYLILGEIVAHYLSRIRKVYPDHVQVFQNTPLNEYHTLTHLVDHELLWGDQTFRILPQNSLSKLQEISLLQPFVESPSEFVLGDPHNHGYGELIWRIVRPRPWIDVGPLHADEWFWRTDNYPKPSPEGFDRVKFWLAIIIEDGNPAFSFVPGSHTLEFDFSTEERGGRMKPKPNFDPDTIPLETLPAHSGNGIVFHDKLLHRGLSGNSLTRVSLEFTAYVRKAA